MENKTTQIKQHANSRCELNLQATFPFILSNKQLLSTGDLVPSFGLHSTWSSIIRPFRWGYWALFTWSVKETISGLWCRKASRSSDPVTMSETVCSLNHEIHKWTWTVNKIIKEECGTLTLSCRCISIYRFPLTGVTHKWCGERMFYSPTLLSHHWSSRAGLPFVRISC